MQKEGLNVVDLFCGAGGLSTGFSKEGFKILLGIDFFESALKTLIKNKKGDRFLFLPKSWFIEDFIIDFQKIRTLKFEHLKEYSKMAELDETYAHYVLSKFVEYYGRVGVRDFDTDSIIERVAKDKADNLT